MMADRRHISAKYDTSSDVLYVIARQAPATRGVEDENGIVWRYAGDGELLGATVLDFHEVWDAQMAQLFRRLAVAFAVEDRQARVAVEHALRP